MMRYTARSAHTLPATAAAAILALIAVFGYATVEVAAQVGAQPCHLIGPGGVVPPGFGAPYNVFAASQPLLVAPRCGAEAVSLEVGTGSTHEYVYTTGYRWDGEEWKPYTLASADIMGGVWAVGRAESAFPNAILSRDTPNFIVAYVCTWHDDDWKCGCRDEACATPRWQLQAFEISVELAENSGDETSSTNGAADTAQEDASESTDGALLMRDGPRLLWRGEDASPLVGINTFVYIEGRSLAERKQDLETIRDLGANLVRLVIHPGEYRAYRPEAWDRIDALVEHARGLGMFPIIDYHVIGMPNGWHEGASWASDEVQPIYDTDVALARDFWRKAAARFKDRGDVIFELWNEPVDEGRSGWEGQWEKFAPTWQTLIDDIRGEGAKNFILVAGDHWARNLIGYERHPLADPEHNFGFAYHEYHWGEPQNAAMFLDGLEEQYPVIGTEWGMEEEMSAPTRGAFQDFVDVYLDEAFVGWTAWSWSVASAPHLLDAFEPVDLNPFGEYVKRKIKEAAITARP